MTPPWRLLTTGYHNGFINMAVDEAMFESCKAGRITPTLRLYGWRPPAFSVGRFQNTGDVLDMERCRENEINVVGRITGGGTLFHDCEITYSIVCSTEDLDLNGSVKESYKKICSFLFNAYRTLGLKPYFASEETRNPSRRYGTEQSEENRNPTYETVNLRNGETSKLQTPNSELRTSQSPPAFCLAGREEFDILIEGKKIGGNAQRRYKNVILQHGIIPLSLDRERISFFLKKPSEWNGENSSSMEELLGRPVTFDEMGFLLKRSFQETFGIRWNGESD